MTDFDATLVEKILNVSKLQREANMQNHCQTDDLWTRH